MAKKKAAKRYISARNLSDGRVWQRVVPSFVGKVKVGDLVVVAEPGVGCYSGYELAEVVSVDPCAVHNHKNVWPVVDKVHVKRWERANCKAAVKAQLLEDMARRQVELDALAKFGASADKDGEMKRLLKEYGELS